MALTSTPARSQETPKSGEPELELPAAPAPEPEAPESSKPTEPAASPLTSPNAPAPSGTAPLPAAPQPVPSAGPGADTARLAELERRLVAVEKRNADLERTVAKRTAEEGERPRWLQRDPEITPFTRSVRLGFLLSAYAQADCLHSQQSEDQLQGDTPLNQTRFFLRRARLRLDQGWDYAAFTLDFDANTVSGPVVGIRRAEASLYYQGGNARTGPPLVMLTGGITDVPFGYEIYESERTSMFMERSLVSSALWPTRQDAGIKISGAVAFIRYGLSLTNGEAVDAHGFPRDPNSAKDLTGRVGVDVPIGHGFYVSGGASFAQGHGFHRGTSATKPSLSWTDGNGDGQVEAGEIVAAPAIAATPSQNFDRWAYGLDLGLYIRTGIGETHLYGELIAASNYDRGFRPSDPVNDRVDVRQLGGYAAITQEFTPYAFAGFRYSTYDPNADFLEQRQGKSLPKTQTVQMLSPLVGLALPKRARLFFQYDFVRDYLARDGSGVPTDAKNDVWTVRLQGNL
jgi:hypothetical protein